MVLSWVITFHLCFALQVEVGSFRRRMPDSAVFPQDPSATGPDWSVWIARGWQRSWRRALHRYRRHAWVPDCFLAAGLCRKEGTRPHWRGSQQPQDSAGTVSAQAVHRLPWTGEFPKRWGLLNRRTMTRTKPMHSPVMYNDPTGLVAPPVLSVI